MKPDGTHTKEEILELMNELQSWERDEICIELLKECSDRQLYDVFSRYTPEYISEITGYYVYQEEREDVSEMSLRDFMCDSDYDVVDLWEYIEDNVAESGKLDKTVLLDHIDCDVLIKYFNARFDIETEIKNNTKKED